ncbi:hypothetical protein ACROYT_G025387 [Oculina patagonica]
MGIQYISSCIPISLQNAPLTTQGLRRQVETSIVSAGYKLAKICHTSLTDQTPDAAEREERLRAIPSANYNYCLQALLKNITTQTEAEELFPAEYAKCMDEYEPIKKAKGNNTTHRRFGNVSKVGKPENTKTLLGYEIQMGPPTANGE